MHRLPVQTSPRRELPQLAVVRRARDHLLQRPDEAPRIIDLCRAVGGARPWLQWSFNEV